MLAQRSRLALLIFAMRRQCWSSTQAFGCECRWQLGGRGEATYYMLAYMGDRYDVELEPEVREWLDTLSLADYRTVEYHADRLAEAPTTLGEPYSRHLRGDVRELRFHLGRSAWRISYWLAPHRRIVLLTVFRKTRSREAGEVERAVATQRVCEDQHQAAMHVYD